MRESSTKYKYIVSLDLGNSKYAILNKIKAFFMNNFWCTLDHCLCDQMKRNQMNGTCDTYMGREKYMQSSGEEN